MSGPSLLRGLDDRRLVVAIDPGKVNHRVWLSTGAGELIGEPVSLPVSRSGIEELERLIGASGFEDPVIGIEATGALHRSWSTELERRHPGSLRLLAPSETQAARTQLGARRFKTDDRDCAALVWLLRQGAGRPAQSPDLDALLGAVRHRRQLVSQRKVLQQRMHDQLNVLCPGLSAPAGHGRSLVLEDTSGQAVLACAVAFEGRSPGARSLIARAPGRLAERNARFWAERWRELLGPPPDAGLRAERLGRDLDRWRVIQEDIAHVDAQIEVLFEGSPGEILMSLPGVAITRAATFSAHTLPIERFKTAEHLYSATGLAPASYQSASVHRRGGISRQGLPDHRDALVGIALGLSQHSSSFRERKAELSARGMKPLQVRIAIARHACRLCFALLKSQQPFDEERYGHQRHSRGR